MRLGQIELGSQLVQTLLSCKDHIAALVAGAPQAKFGVDPELLARSAQLLEIASQYPGFPVTLETVRECLQDVFDVPGLTGLMRDLAARRIRLVDVETSAPSPFGRSLLFRYVGAFMYEGDAPLAERRAQALALDSSLLAELLDRATRPDLVYSHTWSVGDTVIWDNNGVLHRAAPYDPDSPREMLRTTVLGDEPIQ